MLCGFVISVQSVDRLRFESEGDKEVVVRAPKAGSAPGVGMFYKATIILRVIKVEWSKKFWRALWL